MSINVKATTNSKVAAYLSKAHKHLRDEVQRTLNDGKNEAVLSIVEHRSTGRRYGNHTASAPDNPPNADKNTLHNSITVELDSDRMGGAYVATAPHAIHLEFGAPEANLEERPFMGPSARIAFANYQKRKRKWKTKTKV